MLKRKPYTYRITFKNDYTTEVELSVSIERPTGPWDVRDDYAAIIAIGDDELAALGLPTSDFSVDRIACGGMIVAEF